MNKAVIGHSGRVGSVLVKLGYQPIKGNIVKGWRLSYNLEHHKPNVLILAAALTDVDECERKPKKALEVNVRGALRVSNLFGLSRPFNRKKRLIYISTDHVFSSHEEVGLHTEDETPKPMNSYGFTKFSAEAAISGLGFDLHRYLVVRTSKLFDSEYVKNVIKKVESSEKVVVNNVYRRTFLHVKHFCDMLNWVVDYDLEILPVKLFSSEYPIINLTGSVPCTYYEFYRQILILSGREHYLDRLVPRNYLLEEKGESDKAPRPIWGGLSNEYALRLGVPSGNYLEGIRYAAPWMIWRTVS